MKICGLGVAGSPCLQIVSDIQDEIMQTPPRDTDEQGILV